MHRKLRGAASRLRAAAPAPHHDWRSLLRRAWSVRLILVVVALEVANVVMQASIAHPPFSPLWFSALAGLVSAGAFVARILVQRNLGENK